MRHHDPAAWHEQTLGPTFSEMFLLARSSTPDTFLIIFVLLMMLLVPISMIGLVFLLIKRSQKNRAAWNLLAPRLNLVMPNPKHLDMRGTYNGCEVRLSTGSRGSSKHREYFTYAETAFPHSLRFLLHIKSPKSLLSNMFTSNNIQLGVPALDDRFLFEAYHPDILRRLLLTDFPTVRSQNLAEDLLAARRSFEHIIISDQKVYIEQAGQTADEASFRRMLEIATYLARRFYAARERFPVADWEKDLARNWRALAREIQLAFDEDDLIMSGSYKGFAISARIETARRTWQTQIGLSFPTPLGMGLRILPENSIHKALTWVGLQDIEVGMDDFDNAFIVKAASVRAARQRLTPDVCRQLVGLRKLASDFLVDDNQITVTFDEMVGDGRILKSYLEASVTTAKMISS